MAENMLDSYRVLDLTDEKGLLCGKILGDLGADVIKIERPGGDSARNLGPFYHNQPHPEKSLFWFSMNTSKRGITLNLETADGQDIFKKLAAKADFVIESFNAGYMDKLGLGYAALEKVNPKLIMVSISPYGQTGPWKDWKTSDIVAWAIGGEMNLVGDFDRPPIRMSGHSQVFLQSGSDGAMAALAALYGRGATGEGQHVDVSVLDAAGYSSIYYNPAPWSVGRGPGLFSKRGVARQSKHRTIQVWPCKDGWICFNHGGANRLAPSLPIIKWMESEGFTNDFVKNFDWNRPDFVDISQEEMDQIDEPTGRFFLSHTKAELLDGCVKHQVMMYPFATTADMLENPQLAARGFWARLEHPELGETITYPGAFGIFSEAPIRITRRAPLIGEHNEKIYTGELGIPKDKLAVLKQAGII